MDDIKDLSEALSEEVLSEVADNFFGARKSIDNSIDFFNEKVVQLSHKLDEVRNRSVFLRCLLLSPENYKCFWEYLGVSFEDPKLPEEYSCKNFNEGQSFSITLKGKYIKCFRSAYIGLHNAIEDYIFGRYIKTPEGKKILTVNRTDLEKLCALINLKIDKINKDVSPSGVLQFTRSLNPEVLEKEKIGACEGGMCCKLDNDMKFSKIDFQSLGLYNVPLIPEEKNVSGKISKFCGDIYSHNRELIREMLKGFN